MRIGENAYMNEKHSDTKMRRLGAAKRKSDDEES